MSVTTITTPGDGTYTAPGDGTVLCQCWGGGGASNPDAVGFPTNPGGGGAFAQKLYTVTSGQTLAYHNGAGGVTGGTIDGEDTYIVDPSDLMAPAGLGGDNFNFGRGGNWFAYGSGDSGENGADCGTNVDGNVGAGGGSSGGLLSPGVPGSSDSGFTAGTGGVAPAGGGNGGDGGGSIVGADTPPPINGSAPAGGAGGCANNSTVGANGGNGKIIFTFTPSGITFDAASDSAYQAAQSTYSWSHTCTGTNRFLAVDVELMSVPGTIVNSITYNSIPLLFIGAKSTVSGAGRVECWGLANPTSGVNTIVVTLSASIASTGTAVSYTGVHQTSPTEAFNSAQATNIGTADATVDITTVADNCWVHGAVATNDTSITANQTTRNNVTGATGSGADEDNNAAITPPGSVTLSYTGIFAAQTWAIAGYAIRPTSATTIAVYVPIDKAHQPQHQAMVAM